ncbi:nuclear transport factor 2 family protein [Ilumatobacter sp.]|uniref:nuclear transport factor 2 family protein n=1 Tax=Ilumatobacter sp. TaxID=1967498 RepID=UPI00375327D1
MTDDQLAAHLGIQQLYSRYCFGIDDCDPDLFADCFESDGVFGVGPRDFTGDELRFIASREGRPRHFYSNLWVKDVSGDEAISSAYFTVMELSTGQTAGYGHYDDDVRRSADGQWRFARRQVVFHWQTEAERQQTAKVTK